MAISDDGLGQDNFNVGDLFSMDDGDEAGGGSQPPFFGTGEADDAPAPVLGGECVISARSARCAVV